MTFFVEAAELLQDWCEALLRQQVDDPSRPERHGAFRCPSCDFLHGRCGDAVLPLLAMADRSGEARYREAALRVAAWTRNVDAADGAWTNELDPSSWKGITVFGAIAFAEALEAYGHLLDAVTQQAWRSRLRLAGEFIARTFTTDYGNINYAAAGSYGLALLGRLLDEPRFAARGRELAHEVLGFLAEPHGLLYGEGRPAERRSAKGCYPIDLGYNVEESLPALLNYALLTFDETVFEEAARSLNNHCAFLLPDGGWDNSWGTRNFKWTYWGSRTSDGCLTALLHLARRQPFFATDAWRHLRLLRTCTHQGLLHGGPHLASHGVPPCVHHTFCHAKDLANALRLEGDPIRFDVQRQQRRAPSGAAVAAWPAIATFRANLAPWRATVTAYDWLYRPNVFHATGGALSLLWHDAVGVICAASLARYEMVEAHNMQPNPDGEDVCLTPRVELYDEGQWYTNILSLRSGIWDLPQPDGVEVQVEAPLVNAEQDPPPSGAALFAIAYRLRPESVTLTALPRTGPAQPWSLVLPIISPSGEAARWVSDRRVEIAKPGGSLVVEANRPISRLLTRRDRVFNPVGGFEALPLTVASRGQEGIECTLSVVG